MLKNIVFENKELTFEKITTSNHIKVYYKGGCYIQYQNLKNNDLKKIAMNLASTLETVELDQLKALNPDNAHEIANQISLILAPYFTGRSKGCKVRVRVA